MTEYCSKCGEKLKEDAVFCANCGEKVPNKNKTLLNKYVIIIIIIILIVLAVFLSTTFLLNQTQVVKVDNVQFELPADYVKEPSRTEISYDENVKSSAMGWSNDKYYIEIGVTKTPGAGFNSEEVAASLGGTPTKMFGYTGYYLEYENEGCAFIFGLKDEVCMIYVSDYDAFEDVKVIGRV
ncbi:zinc ribbon domain-containing protein [Methanobrevibacter sp.]|uniref:zinc ribbon domain-containing protein n=1 Tax=Methanobrevibacter sp. TaxID=66852 RepID=UPI0025F1D283|nr:zinc ribbon domain-containing protein [Methanobrevibacter sp.]MBR4448511.1 zinc ribbon domain-containing protein [Methanobrevibacter sp.]